MVVHEPLPPAWRRLGTGALLCLALVAAAGHATAGGPEPRPGKARSAASAGTTWAELSPAQREVLAPLASHWAGIDEPRKRKWLAMAASFSRLPPEEQAKLHSRMTEWAALSPQQRTEARLNFAEAQQLSPDDKKAKWEAYQALSPEEKRKLARSAAPRTPIPAAAVRPVPSEKLATVPRSSGDAKPARIMVVPAHEPASSRPAAPVAPAPPAEPAAAVDN
mgnify:CR=1 FL=1